MLSSIHERLATIRKGLFGFTALTVIPAFIGGLFLLQGAWIPGAILWAFGFYNIFTHNFGGDA